LRLQADERLGRMLRPPLSSGDSGGLELPTRETVAIGDVVHIEVSFGALADEIILEGFVTGIAARGERSPLVSIRFRSEHEARVRYVHEVLTKVRAATARKARRHDSAVQTTWHWGLGSQQTRISDISRGGAFVRSAAPPSVGNTVNLEIDDSMVVGSDGKPVRLQATVAWVGRSQGHRGFGVKFRLGNREVAQRIAALVRWHEQS
ncbi:MAG: PilZ domain-containing protein, partial [Myxococcales bacterium]|nr:PilZ domain-containing protein [Myxococcales bacterium]